jgi:hypothetical protein
MLGTDYFVGDAELLDDLAFLSRDLNLAYSSSQECLVFLPKPMRRPANDACLEGQREFRESMAF